MKFIVNNGLCHKLKLYCIPKSLYPGAGVNLKY